MLFPFQGQEACSAWSSSPTPPTPQQWQGKEGIRMAESVKEQLSPCSHCGFAFLICSPNRILQEEMFQIRTFRPANVAAGKGGTIGHFPLLWKNAEE